MFRNVEELVQQVQSENKKIYEVMYAGRTPAAIN